MCGVIGPREIAGDLRDDRIANPLVVDVALKNQYWTTAATCSRSEGIERQGDVTALKIHFLWAS